MAEEQKHEVEDTPKYKEEEEALDLTSVNALADPQDCDAVLETIDSCVACAEGVDIQHEYEVSERLRQVHVEEHGLSDAESALIRLQIMEDASRKETAYFPDLDDLAMCGNEDDLDDAKALSRKTTEATSRSNPTLQCAICYDEAGSSANSPVTFAYLPCCGKDGREETSTTKVCTACILLLSNPTSDGTARIGRCPRCRAWISVSGAGESIQVVESAGQCRICNQCKPCLVENGEVCDACFLGLRRPLLYECEQCHGIQTIPHPMYRYQPTVHEFSNTSWACQGQCKIFTMWKIVPDQVKLIPAGDAPVEWGDDYLEVARARVMEARRGIVEMNGGRNGVGESCLIQ